MAEVRLMSGNYLDEGLFGSVDEALDAIRKCWDGARDRTFEKAKTR